MESKNSKITEGTQLNFADFGENLEKKNSGSGICSTDFGLQIDRDFKVPKESQLGFVDIEWIIQLMRRQWMDKLSPIIDLNPHISPIMRAKKVEVFHLLDNRKQRVILSLSRIPLPWKPRDYLLYFFKESLKKIGLEPQPIIAKPNLYSNYTSLGINGPWEKRCPQAPGGIQIIQAHSDIVLLGAEGSIPLQILTLAFGLHTLDVEHKLKCIASQEEIL